jgi:cob(I)alamin adenosyltransferase
MDLNKIKKVEINKNVNVKPRKLSRTKSDGISNKTLQSGIVVNKYDPTYDMISHLEHLVASIGVARASSSHFGLLKAGNQTLIKNIDFLVDIQKELKTIMDSIALYNNASSTRYDLSLITIRLVENSTISMKVSLPPKTYNIIPGNSISEANFMVSRSHCKLLEKVLWDYKNRYDIQDNILTYINKLEHFFHVMASFVLKVESKTPKRYN